MSVPLVVDSDHIVMVDKGTPNDPQWELYASGKLEECRLVALSCPRAYIYRRETFQGFSRWCRTETAVSGVLYKAVGGYVLSTRPRSLAARSGG